jgi:hypothetical protein
MKNFKTGIWTLLGVFMVFSATAQTTPAYKPAGTSPPPPGTITPKAPSVKPTGISPGAPGVITAPPAPNTTYAPTAIKTDPENALLFNKKVLLKKIDFSWGGTARANFFYNKNDQLIRAEYWGTTGGIPDSTVDHIFYDDQKRITMIASNNFLINNNYDVINSRFAFYYYDDNSNVIRKESYRPGVQGKIGDAFYTYSSGDVIITRRSPEGNRTDTIHRTSDGKKNILFWKKGIESQTNTSYYSEFDPTTRYLPANYNIIYTSANGKNYFWGLFEGNQSLVQNYIYDFADNGISDIHVEVAKRNAYGLIEQLKYTGSRSTWPKIMTFEYIIK